MARKKFTTSLDENIIKQLKMQAVKEGTNASKILEKLIKEYLKKQSQINLIKLLYITGTMFLSENETTYDKITEEDHDWADKRQNTNIRRIEI